MEPEHSRLMKGAGWGGSCMTVFNGSREKHVTRWKSGLLPAARREAAKPVAVCAPLCLQEKK